MRLLIASSWDRTVRIWNVTGDVVASASAPSVGPPIATLFDGKEHSAPILDACLTSDGRAFFGGCCKSAMVWDLTSGQTSQVAAHQLPVSCLRYVSEQIQHQMLITASWDGNIHFWDLRQQRPARTETLGLPIFAMDVSTSPMVTFATGRKLLVYNLQTMSRFTALDPHQLMKFQFRDVSNYENQSAVLVGSAEGRISAIPIGQNTGSNSGHNFCFKAHCVPTPSKHNHYTMYQTNFVAVHPNNGTGVTGGSDGTVRIWNLGGKSQVHEVAARQFEGQAVPVSAGDLSPDGSVIAFGVSYDWSMGKDHAKPNSPCSVVLLPIATTWLRPA